MESAGSPALYDVGEILHVEYGRGGEIQLSTFCSQDRLRSLYRGLDRRWIFERKDDRREFLAILSGLRKFYQLDIYHWFIMSNPI